MCHLIIWHARTNRWEHRWVTRFCDLYDLGTPSAEWHPVDKYLTFDRSKRAYPQSHSRPEQPAGRMPRQRHCRPGGVRAAHCNAGPAERASPV